MAITLKNAYTNQIAITNTTMYTCPAGTTARVLKCTACNDTTTVATFSIHKVESGGAVADDKLIINTKSLAGKETYECPEVVGAVLDAADFLSGIASLASQVTINIDVVEIV